MYKKILVDVNIFQDVLTNREGAYVGAEILNRIKKKELEGWVSANTYGILFYLQRKINSEERARKIVDQILSDFVIIPTRKSVVKQAFLSASPDFEDNLQIESAAQFSLDAIITRNKTDFENSRVPAFTPEEFLERTFNSKVAKEQEEKIQFLDLKAQLKDVYNEIDDEVTNIISNTSFVMGKAVANFESAFAKVHDVKNCLGVSSGTDGNHMVLWALGIGPGDEVIIPANTFIATAWGATLCGATPVFVDCHPESYNIDPSKILAAITPKTKAIVAVHLYGQAADMDGISRSLVDGGWSAEVQGIFVNNKTRQKIYLVEDCAQAHLAEFSGQKVGGLSKASSFSFYPGKNLGAYGEAGAVMTNDDELAKKFKMIRDHGAEQKYIHLVYGHNYRMEGIQGAVLGVKLKYIEQWTEGRRRAAAKYRELLGDIDEIILPKEMEYAKHVYHLFVIQVKSQSVESRVQRRDLLQKYFTENGIATGLHYPVPLHLQPCFEHLGYKKGDFPVSEQLAEQGLSLPMYPELTDEQLNYISEKIHLFFKK
ncbi:MAG: hypothetical protein STSR0008_14180 [Ignavibacterium sp.]